jgi:hypothetical protein
MQNVQPVVELDEMGDLASTIVPRRCLFNSRHNKWSAGLTPRMPEMGIISGLKPGLATQIIDAR